MEFATKASAQAMAEVRAAPATTARRARSAQARPDRRLAILLAAERLFAESGYHAVTIRQIAELAEVPLALVGYYFGQKHELFAAIFEHWQPTLDERLARLDAAVQAGGPALLRHIVEAFVDPVLRLRASAEGEYYALLVGRELFNATPESDAVIRRWFDPLAHAYIDALCKALPHATRAQLAWAYQFALGSLLHHLGDQRIERLSRRQARANDPTAREYLVGFIEGGIQAAFPARGTRRSSASASAKQLGRQPAKPTTAPGQDSTRTGTTKRRTP